jgi:hypothetical protein
MALLAIWAKGLEHRITFSLDNQKTVNFLITAIANTFGTVRRTPMTEDYFLTVIQMYTAALVFVTQRLWTRRSLPTERILTATHDSTTVWTGIGSALSQLWSQRTTSGSGIGVLSVFLYLANILVLHITTPALFRSKHSTTLGLSPLQHEAYRPSSLSPRRPSPILITYLPQCTSKEG